MEVLTGPGGEWQGGVRNGGGIIASLETIN